MINVVSTSWFKISFNVPRFLSIDESGTLPSMKSLLESDMRKNARGATVMETHRRSVNF
jgi:hypothetical protein